MRISAACWRSRRRHERFHCNLVSDPDHSGDLCRRCHGHSAALVVSAPTRSSAALVEQLLGHAMSDPITGPLSREQFKALVDAPFGHATKEIRKIDPLYGRADGEKFEFEVRCRATSSTMGTA